ncbi:thioredoxin domain-containing protein [Amnibacterium sp. CER49]|uniref:thioredoxin domain-containing protein n=1 Tax=Amnibacterium sp. CER49 TaxID=3039161 RepID=UPI002447C9C2|nr:thioredoxin domain-containing protein [Amnibacterium sp. CER49]MDH2444217.1 thioredoxin domain-containing protein [Amnibacterium sp. CER49]
MNRLADAVSPYLRSHADNPVAWYPWGDEAFAEARRRDVPVLVSIGYATCHWCHVMARESFSDPALAGYLNEHLVAIKVDREEHPEVDAACLAGAGAFTPNLGWPLNVFLTPEGRMFHAGTYSPPRPMPDNPSFRQVLEAVVDAWTTRRDDVESSAGRLADALAEAARQGASGGSGIGLEDLGRAAGTLVAYEDREHGGFGGAPKFPVPTVLLTMLALGRSPLLQPEDADRIRGVAERALAAMREGGLRDAVEGGFFRYATRRDWSEPHYERMLSDNALLLRAYAEVGDRDTAAGIAAFLRGVLRRPEGGFASAQDSESLVDGQRSEGGYYRLTAEERRHQPPPAVDAKVLTSWNGLAIGGLARAGALLGEPTWVVLAEEAAEFLLASHRRPDGTLLRASLDGRPSTAAATLEDYGALADGLLELALAAGRPDLAVAARDLVDRCLVDGRFAVPGGGDPTLAGLGLGLSAEADVSEGAAPSGLSSMARAAERLFLLTGERSYREAAAAALAPVLPQAAQRPIGSGAMLGVALAQLEPVRQLVVVTDDPASPLAAAARTLPTSVTAVLTERAVAAFAEAGFELFEGRTTVAGAPAAYLCRDFVCRLPVTDPAALLEQART